MQQSVFRTKNNRSRRFIFGETGHSTILSQHVEVIVCDLHLVVWDDKGFLSDTYVPRLPV